VINVFTSQICDRHGVMTVNIIKMSLKKNIFFFDFGHEIGSSSRVASAVIIPEDKILNNQVLLCK